MSAEYHLPNLQREIYETWQLWKQRPIERNFCNKYVKTIIKDYPEDDKKNYLRYWNCLKNHSEMCDLDEFLH